MLNYNHIKELAKKRGIALETLGPKIDLSPPGFRKSIASESLSFVHAVKLSKVLRCRLEDLIGSPSYDSTREPSITKEPDPEPDQILLRQMQLVKEEVISLEKQITQYFKTSKSHKSQS